MSIDVLKYESCEERDEGSGIITTEIWPTLSRRILNRESVEAARCAQ